MDRISRVDELSSLMLIRSDMVEEVGVWQSSVELAVTIEAVSQVVLLIL